MNFEVINSVAQLLDNHNITYTLTPLFDGYRLGSGNWDIVCHSWSLGGRSGLVESLGLRDPRALDDEQYFDDVIGYLTYEDMMNLLKYNKIL